MKRIFFTGVIVLLLCVPAAAQWPSNNLLNLTVSAAQDTQWEARIAADGFGGAVIVWQDRRSLTHDWEIYAQRVSAYGDTMWQKDGVPVCQGWDDQIRPQLVTDRLAGGAIIVWDDYRNGNCDIYAQWIDPDGDPVWTVDGVPVCTTSGEQSHAQLVPDDYDGVIVAWEDLRGGDIDIYAQRIDQNGDPVWSTNGAPVCSIASNQANPLIVSDHSHGAVIAWEDDRGFDTDIYAQRIDDSGMSLWAQDGDTVVIAQDYQRISSMITDGMEGAIIAWDDPRADGFQYDIYVQRIDYNGDPAWLPADGLPVCTLASQQERSQMIPQGSGGAIIVWEDFRGGDYRDIYAQRIHFAGIPFWEEDGVLICGAAWDQALPQICADESGGAIITWYDFRLLDDKDIYAQRIDSTGTILWAPDGVPVGYSSSNTRNPKICSDWDGGAIIVWDEDRGQGSDYDIYAQRVNHNGTLGPVPHIVSVTDVPNDQGGYVAVLWDRSYLDDEAYGEITEYSVWRKYPPGSKGEVPGETWDGTLPDEIRPGIIRRIQTKDKSGAVKDDFWELMGKVRAHFWEGYAFIAETLDDSSAAGVPYFSYLISAHTDDPFAFWDSQEDSGYSVDNVNPAKTQLTAQPATGGKSPATTIWLSWEEVTAGVDGSPETDSLLYRVYFDTGPDFTPGPGNLLATTKDLEYSHSDSRIGDPATNLYYAVTAVDGGDNESEASNVVGEFDKRLTRVK
jgi:hypothetical protein